MATKTKPTKSKSPALPPVGATCQECQMGSPIYIPCSKPAVRIITHSGLTHGGETYAMCVPCAEHNVKNRGARYILQGEEYKITKTPSLLEAMKASHATKGTPAKSTAGSPSGQAAGKATRASAPTDDVGSQGTAKGSSTQVGAPAADRNAKEPDEMMPDFDEAPASEDQLTAIKTLGEKQLDLLRRIAIKEKELRALTDELGINRDLQLPEALTQVGMEQFTLTGGWKVALRNIVSASVPKQYKEMAHEYLDKMGGGASALIKRTIVIRFGKGEDAWAKKFIRDLEQRKKKVDCEISETVHGGSLTAWVKEMDRDNKSINEKLLGVFRKKIAEVKIPAGVDLTIPQ